MSTWTDDFTHDYFADHTYTLPAGGGGFTVGGGHLDLGAGVTAVWVDERSSGFAGHVELDIDNIEELAFLELGLIDPGLANGALGFLSPSGSAGVEWVAGAGSNSNGASFTLPGSGPVTVVVTISTSELRLDAASQSVTLALSPSEAAALEALTIFPFVLVQAGSGDLLMSKWEHTYAGTGPPPLPAPYIKAGAQESGASLLRHPLLVP